MPYSKARVWQGFCVLISALPLVSTLRSNVVVSGTTPATVDRISGKCENKQMLETIKYDLSNVAVAQSCPESHPFPYDDFKHCCSEKQRNAPGCGGQDGTLLGRDPADCCKDVEALQCPHPPPCKMHEKGFERQSKSF